MNPPTEANLVRAAILIATVGMLEDDVPMPCPNWVVRLVARILDDVDAEVKHRTTSPRGE